MENSCRYTFKFFTQNPVKHLRWSIWQKQLTVESRELFSQERYILNFKWILNVSVLHIKITSSDQNFS